MLIKYSQDPLASALQYAAVPIGVGLGLKGLHYAWTNSPAIRSAMLLGAPYALYKYLSYSNESNLLRNVVNENKKLFEELRSNKDYAMLLPDVINNHQQIIYNKNYEKYMQPAKSALYDAMPLFAIGAALPSAIKLLI